MTQELETAAAGSLGGFIRLGRRKRHVFVAGEPCANCATELLGPWCYHCGQLGEDFHRSTWKLIAEAFEGLLHLDGRVWATLPDLFFAPGRLTRSYLDGHRAPQIPPLRLFLVVLLVVFVAGSLGGGKTTTVSTDHDKSGDIETLSPDQRAKAKEVVSHVQVDFGKPNQNASKWLQDRLNRVIDDPERFKLVLEQWAERFAFLSLPMAAALLSLVFVFQRRFYVFDHTIFALHSLSAAGLMFSVAQGFSGLTLGVSQFLWLGMPIHLFVHMRSVYGTGVIGTLLLRMFVIFVGSIVGFTLIILGLLWVGLSRMA